MIPSNLGVFQRYSDELSLSPPYCQTPCATTANPANLSGYALGRARYRQRKYERRIPYSPKLLPIVSHLTFFQSLEDKIRNQLPQAATSVADRSYNPPHAFQRQVNSDVIPDRHLGERSRPDIQQPSATTTTSITVSVDRGRSITISSYGNANYG